MFSEQHRANYGRLIHSSCDIAMDYYFAGRLDRAIQFLIKLTEITDGQDAAEVDQAMLWATLGKLQSHHCFMSSNGFERALSSLETAKELATSLNAQRSLATALEYIGFTKYSKTFHQNEGAYEDALAEYEKALGLRESIEDHDGIAQSLVHIGIIHERLEDKQTAKSYYGHALEVSLAHDLKLEQSYAFRHLAFLRDEQGDLDGALDYFKRSLELRESIGFYVNLSLSFLSVGEVLLEQKAFDEAMDYIQRAYDHAKEMDLKRVMTICLYVLAEAHAVQDQVDRALEYLRQSKSLSESINYPVGIQRADARIEALAK